MMYQLNPLVIKFQMSEATKIKIQLLSDARDEVNVITQDPVASIPR